MPHLRFFHRMMECSDPSVYNSMMSPEWQKFRNRGSWPIDCCALDHFNKKELEILKLKHQTEYQNFFEVMQQKHGINTDVSLSSRAKMVVVFKYFPLDKSYIFWIKLWINNLPTRSLTSPWSTSRIAFKLAQYAIIKRHNCLMSS